jgi:hypothetical protein
LEDHYKKRFGAFLKDAVNGVVTLEKPGKLKASELLHRMDQTGVLPYSARDTIPEGRIADWKRGKGNPTDEQLLALRRALCADPAFETDNPLLQPIPIMCQRWDEVFRQGKYVSGVSPPLPGKPLKHALDKYHDDMFLGIYQCATETWNQYFSGESVVPLPSELALLGMRRGYSDTHIDQQIQRFFESDQPSEKKEALYWLTQLYCYPRPLADNRAPEKIQTDLNSNDSQLAIRATLDVITWTPLLSAPWDEERIEIFDGFIDVLLDNLGQGGGVSEIAAYALYLMTRAFSLKHQALFIGDERMERVYDMLCYDKNLSPLTVRWLACVAGRNNLHPSIANDYVGLWARVADGAMERSAIKPPFRYPPDADIDRIALYLERYRKAETTDELIGLAIMLRRIGYGRHEFFQDFVALLDEKEGYQTLKDEALAYLTYDYGKDSAMLLWKKLMNPSEKPIFLKKDWAFLALIGTADLAALSKLFEKSLRDPSIDSLAIFHAAATGFKFGQGRMLITPWWRTARGRKVMWSCLTRGVFKI